MREPRRLQSSLSAPASLEGMEALLRELVEIPSGTRDPAGLERMQAVMRRELRALGLEVSEGPAGVVVARPGHAGLRPAVLLVGHVDTVYSPDDPFRTLTETRSPGGQRMLRGPGAIDMKGGLVVLVWALRALREAGLLQRAACTVLLNRDEEQGSTASGPFIAAESRRHDLALILEPGFDGPDGSTTVVVERAGLGRVRVAVHGVEAHSGNQRERGVSAVAAAARMVAPIDGLTAAGDGRLVTVCTFEGGKSINQVPGRAVLGVDVRFRDSAQWEAVRARLEEIAATTVERSPLTGAATHAQVEVLSVKPPMPRHPGVDPYLEILLKAASELGQPLSPTRRNGTSDGNFTAAAGTPTLDGLGAVGVGMHVSGGEAARASSLAERAQLLALTLARLWK